MSVFVEMVKVPTYSERSGSRNYRGYASLRRYNANGSRNNLRLPIFIRLLQPKEVSSINRRQMDFSFTLSNDRNHASWLLYVGLFYHQTTHDSLVQLVAERMYCTLHSTYFEFKNRSTFKNGKKR